LIFKYGSEKDKKAVLEKTAISWWAKVMNWDQFKKVARK